MSGALKQERLGQHFSVKRCAPSIDKCEVCGGHFFRCRGEHADRRAFTIDTPYAGGKAGAIRPDS